jgi:spermidine synthase
MVDLDRELVEFCKEHLKSWHQGAFEEPRAKLLYQDAFKYLRRPGPKFDVIISDISDPTEGGPAVMAYTREFFQEVRERLSPQGLFVTQATEALMSPHEVLSVIYRTVKSVFEVAECYVEYIPSFVCLWGWVVGSRMHRPSALSAQELSRRIAQRGLKLRFYSPQMQQRLFSLPPYLQGRLRRQRQVATAQEPARVYGGQR